MASKIVGGRHGTIFPITVAGPVIEQWIWSTGHVCFAAQVELVPWMEPSAEVDIFPGVSIVEAPFAKESMPPMADLMEAGASLQCDNLLGIEPKWPFTIPNVRHNLGAGGIKKIGDCDHMKIEAAVIQNAEVLIVEVAGIDGS